MIEIKELVWWHTGWVTIIMIGANEGCQIDNSQRLQK